MNWSLLFPFNISYSENSFVNLFKLIFACIEGKEPNFVEDKFFYANQDLKKLGKETYIDDKLKEWTQLKDY